MYGIKLDHQSFVCMADLLGVDEEKLRSAIFAGEKAALIRDFMERMLINPQQDEVARVINALGKHYPRVQVWSYSPDCPYALCFTGGDRDKPQRSLTALVQHTSRGWEISFRRGDRFRVTPIKAGSTL